MINCICEWNKDGDGYHINAPIDNQTLHMEFQETYWTSDTTYINVYMTLYNKRKHIESNEANVKMTGLNPIKTALVARRCFNLLEEVTVKHYLQWGDVIIYCGWLDNRRRDTYYKVLSRKGYTYGKLEGKKCIMKRFKSMEDVV